MSNSVLKADKENMWKCNAYLGQIRSGNWCTADDGTFDIFYRTTCMPKLHVEIVYRKRDGHLVQVVNSMFATYKTIPANEILDFLGL